SNTPTNTPTNTPINVLTNTPTNTPTNIRTNTPTNTATGTLTPIACVVSFTDVLPGSAFYEYVTCIYCRGAIGGYNDGTFRPGATVTRGQVCKITVLGFQFPINTTNGPHFTDVPRG